MNTNKYYLLGEYIMRTLLPPCYFTEIFIINTQFKRDLSSDERFRRTICDVVSPEL